jgi:hypothetical protein
MLLLASAMPVANFRTLNRGTVEAGGGSFGIEWLEKRAWRIPDTTSCGQVPEAGRFQRPRSIVLPCLPAPIADTCAGTCSQGDG